MAMVNFTAGTKIIETGQSVDKLLFIMKGTVRVTYEGGFFDLKNQDVMGIAAIGARHSHASYIALENTSAVEYSLKDGISELIKNNRDIRKYILSSLFVQTAAVISQHKVIREAYENVYGYIKTAYEDYKWLCEKSETYAKELGDFNLEGTTEIDNLVPVWTERYYSVLGEISKDSDYGAMDCDYITGLIVKTARDISQIMFLGQDVVNEKENCLSFLMNENENDLLGLYMSLYIHVQKKLGPEDDRTKSVLRMIYDILDKAKNFGMAKNDFYEDRKEKIGFDISKLLERVEEQNEEEANEEGLPVADLKDSMLTILKFSEMDFEFAEEFREKVSILFKKMAAGVEDDEVRKLRNGVTKDFNIIYQAAFLKSVKTDSLPPVIKMFLNFGYMDENLVGMDTAIELLRLSESNYSDPEYGIYSMYEWLKSIYDGQKDPGRNEFEVDYAEYLHEQVRNKEILKTEEEALFNDSELRVKYEIENVFPVVNKISTGRIVSFCPILSDINMIKAPENMLVTWKGVTEIIKEIRSVDRSCFYRETMYMSKAHGIDKEIIDVEILPNVILTPNIGNRGIMWQEIEGKRRTTAARFFLSVFQQEDLKMQLIKLAGHFRWELCKRIQGARWNDPGEHSLTAEYFDYIQYYRKNNDLSPEAKDKIKSDLTRCKNSFREMFIRDYTVWVLFESQGSPRLNKVVRGILFGYIPFSMEICNKLRINPMYKDFIERYDTKRKAKLHRMDNLIKKLNNNGVDTPNEILAQRRFLEG